MVELEKKFLTAKDPIRVPPEAKVKPKKLVRPQGEKYDCAKCSVTITKVVDGTDLKGYGSKYANGYVCDQCHRSDATWPMFHCTGCNWVKHARQFNLETFYIAKIQYLMHQTFEIN